MAAGPNADKTLSLAGLDFIKCVEEEGGKPKLKAYNDGTGTWTIGWGCTKGVTKGMTITVPEAEQMLSKELAGHIDEVHRLIKRPISQGLFDVMVSFFFNHGAGNCPTLINAVNAGSDDKIRAALMIYTKATDEKTGKKVTWPGLVNRRTAEIQHWAKMDDMDPTVPTPVVVGRLPVAQEPPPPPAKVAVAAKSRTVWALLLAAAGKASDFFFNLTDKAASVLDKGVALVTDVNSQVGGKMEPLISLGETMKVNVAPIGTVLLIVLVIIGIVRHIDSKHALVAAQANEGDSQ